MALNLYVQCSWLKQRTLAAATKEMSTQGWVIPSSAYVCVHTRVHMHVCVCVCKSVQRVCCSVWKYTHSSFTPTSSSKGSSASMRSSKQSTSQTPATWVAEDCVWSPAAIVPLTPAQTNLQWQLPKHRQKATTPHPLLLTWLTPLCFLCALRELWTRVFLPRHGLFYLDGMTQT